jgi:hypothetical protein
MADIHDNYAVIAGLGFYVDLAKLRSAGFP